MNNILTSSGGWTKLIPSMGIGEDKQRIYIHTKNIEAAKNALAQSAKLKDRIFSDFSYGPKFNATLKEKPYLLKKGCSFRLISVQEAIQCLSLFLDAKDRVRTALHVEEESRQTIFEANTKGAAIGLFGTNVTVGDGVSSDFSSTQPLAQDTRFTAKDKSVLFGARNRLIIDSKTVKKLL